MVHTGIHLTACFLLKLNSEELLLAAPPEEEENTAAFRADDPALVALQQKMAQLYLKQKEKGGIIDLEEEKNKFLLSSNRVSHCIQTHIKRTSYF